MLAKSKLSRPQLISVAKHTGSPFESYLVADPQRQVFSWHGSLLLVAENLEMNKPVRFDGKTYLQYFNEITKM